MTKPTPRYNHKWHGAEFLGRVSINGTPPQIGEEKPAPTIIDVYSYCDPSVKEQVPVGVIFAFGCEGHEYFSAPITDFPIKSFREHVAKASRLCLTSTVLNECWRQSQKWWK